MLYEGRDFFKCISSVNTHCGHCKAAQLRMVKVAGGKKRFEGAILVLSGMHCQPQQTHTFMLSFTVSHHDLKQYFSLIACGTAYKCQWHGKWCGTVAGEIL
jgi:hypothetical protein